MEVLGELQVAFPDGKLRKLLSGKESAGPQIRKTQKGKARPAKGSRSLPLEPPFHRMLSEGTTHDQVGLPTATKAVGTLLW